MIIDPLWLLLIADASGLIQMDDDTRSALVEILYPGDYRYETM